MKLCSWCKKKPVKRAKSDTCSTSCGAQKRWHKMTPSEQLKRFQQNCIAANQTKYFIRLQGELKRECEVLGLPFDSAHAKFYTRARNNGYHNGYYTGFQRGRKS